MPKFEIIKKEKKSEYIQNDNLVHCILCNTQLSITTTKHNCYYRRN